jgi:hypothetical protein
MSPDENQQLIHLFIKGTSKTERYTSPLPGRQGFFCPAHKVPAHGAKLLKQIDEARTAAQEHNMRKTAVGLLDQKGMYLEFHSEPDFELALDSLESEQQGIELTAVRQQAGVMLATVFIPESKIAYLIKKVESYTSQQTPKRRGKK